MTLLDARSPDSAGSNSAGSNSAPSNTAGSNTAPSNVLSLIDAPATTQLSLRDITKTYVPKDGPVLSGISLDVAEGELVSLLGPSGCGKSTLLRIVAGFIDASGGRVVVGGEDVTTTPTHRRNVGIVHQSHALWPHLTVAENVAFGLEMQRVKRAERERRASEMLDLVGLGGYDRRLPTELSGGQQQRVALARALVIEPKVLLLDEPLSSLDANLRVYLREEIRRLQRELGVTTLFVTHDREEAMAVSDRIVVLEGGHVAQLGSAIDLYRSPRSRFVMNFTGATVELPGEVTEAGPERSTIVTPVGTFRLPVTDSSVGAEVAVCIRPDDFTLADGSASDTDHLGVDGVLIDAAFLGTSAEVRVEVATGDGATTLIPVRLPARQFERLPGVGDPIRLAVDLAHVQLFPA